MILLRSNLYILTKVHNKCMPDILIINTTRFIFMYLYLHVSAIFLHASPNARLSLYLYKIYRIPTHYDHYYTIGNHSHVYI